MTTATPVTALRPLRVALTGMVSLGVAMGIGRFAFTPILPMMLADNVVTITGASFLASANYLGYLVGALLCMLQPWIWQRLGWHVPPNGPYAVRLGLIATTLLTLGMALQWPDAWPTLRFAAGVASAMVFVYISGWCLGQLARLGVPALGATIYMGPGAGIVLSGLAASGMVAAHGSSTMGWLVFGLLAAVLTACVWATLQPRNEVPRAAAATSSSASSASSASSSAASTPGSEAVPHATAEITLLSIAYGFAGFGYIITATFLPVIARQQLRASIWLDLFWPIFGAGVMLGAFLASRIRRAGDLRLRLALCYVVQALGIATSLLEVSAAGFALGSLLLGLPFTVITYFTMQEARRLRPLQTASLMGLLTATYGLGQIVGPPLTAAVLAHSASVGGGFTLALEIAAGTLLLGAALLGYMARRFVPPAR